MTAALTPSLQQQKHPDNSCSNSCTKGSKERRGGWGFQQSADKPAMTMLPSNSEHTWSQLSSMAAERCGCMAGMCVKPTGMLSSLHCTDDFPGQSVLYSSDIT